MMTVTMRGGRKIEATSVGYVVATLVSKPKRQVIAVQIVNDKGEVILEDPRDLVRIEPRK